jgi:hypothetical protein
LNAYRQFCPNESPNRRTHDESIHRSNLESNVKLPRIDLPHFDGTSKDWPAFRDSFVSLIHENQTLSDIHKFQYLLSATKGEANALVRTLPLTEINYSIIWNKLLSRFDNKRLLASMYIDEIMNFENLTFESPAKLRQLLDTVNENISALERIRLSDSLGDFIIFQTVIKKLDKRTRHLFEEEYSKDEFPTLENLKYFLTNHCKAIEAAHCNDAKPKPVGPKVNLKFNKAQPATNPAVRLGQNNKSFVSNTGSSSSPTCIYCTEDHVVYRCPRFDALTSQQRKEFVRSKRICFNCLSPSHMIDKCHSTNTCRVCNQRHHTLLHLTQTSKPAANSDKPTPNSASDTNINPANTSQPQHAGLGLTVNTGISNETNVKQSVTLLGTIKLNIQDKFGNFKLFRALVDPGSQLSFITENCVRELGLPRQRYHLPITGLSQTPVNATKGVVNCLLKPNNHNQPNILATAVVLEKITSPLPTCSIPTEVRQAFKTLDLADDEFDIPGQIDFLLGADLYPHTFDGGRLHSPVGLPTPYHSVFGWVLIGPTHVNLVSVASDHDLGLGQTSHLCTLDNNSLDMHIKQFWELEEFPKTFHASDDDKFCEDHFLKTHTRDAESGRYIVKLPFREDAPELGSSFQTAVSRLRSL